jgi:hypothetical protein
LLEQLTDRWNIARVDRVQEVDIDRHALKKSGVAFF